MRRAPLAPVWLLALGLLGALGWQSPTDDQPVPPEREDRGRETDSGAPNPQPDGEIDVADLHDLPVASFVRTIDGDTILVRIAGKVEKVRLLGVRAAAVDKSEGKDCREALENLLRGEDVWLRPGKPTGGAPRGTREAFVHRCPDGLLINLELVRQGWADASPSKCEDHDTFVYYAKRAKEHERGKWSPTRALKQPREPAIAPPPSAGSSTETSPPIAPVAGLGETRDGDQADAGSVFVTTSGKKYHRSTCRHLRGKGKSITLADAGRRGYSPCTVCKP